MPPPLLYDLTELQRHANRLWGFSAKRTLELAQELYESKSSSAIPARTVVICRRTWPLRCHRWSRQSVVSMRRT